MLPRQRLSRCLRVYLEFMISRTRVSKSRLKASGVFPLPRGQPAVTERQMGNWRSHNHFANSPEQENRRAPAKLQRVIAFPVTPFHPDLSGGYCGIENKSARAPPPPDGSDRRCGRHRRDVFPYPLRESGSCTDCGGRVAGVFR